MKNLVTGGAGFMGAHVTQELLDRSEEVVVLDDLSGGFEDNVPKGATFLKGSVTDVELVNKLFEEHKLLSTLHNLF